MSVPIRRRTTLLPPQRLAAVRGTILYGPAGRVGDGDTIRLVGPRAFDEDDRPVPFVFRLSTTTSSLPVRLLGIDSPEETYSGSALPGLGMPYARAFPGGTVPQQEPWASQAKAFTDSFFRPGDRVTVELDERIFDRNQRLLGYAFRGDRVQGPAANLNLQLLRQGWAALYQVHPNLRYLAELRQAVEAAQSEGLGIWPSLEDRRTLRVEEVSRRTALNPPFVYRKMVDAYMAGVAPAEAFRRAGRWVGDLDTLLLHRPERWMDVPHGRRMFIERSADARALGYRVARAAGSAARAPR